MSENRTTDLRASMMEQLRRYQEEARTHVRTNLAPQAGRKVERSIADELAERPAPVVFGTGDNAMEFHIYPKPHVEADRWRLMVIALLNEFAPVIRQEMSVHEHPFGFDPDSFLRYLNLIVVGHVAAAKELVFMWEPTLPREQILEELGTTDAQLATAFMECLKFAFPFSEIWATAKRLFSEETKAKDK